MIDRKTAALAVLAAGAPASTELAGLRHLAAAGVLDALQGATPDETRAALGAGVRAVARSLRERGLTVEEWAGQARAGGARVADSMVADVHAALEGR